MSKEETKEEKEKRKPIIPAPEVKEEGALHGVRIFEDKVVIFGNLIRDYSEGKIDTATLVREVSKIVRRLYSHPIFQQSVQRLTKYKGLISKNVLRGWLISIITVVGELVKLIQEELKGKSLTEEEYLDLIKEVVTEYTKAVSISEASFYTTVKGEKYFRVNVPKEVSDLLKLRKGDIIEVRLRIVKRSE